MVGTNCLGGIIGDTAGSVYEWHNAKNKEDIRLFNTIGVRPTDDSVLTCAVADWLMTSKERDSEVLIDKLKEYANAFPHAGYGGKFSNWAFGKDREPINSFGNGSGMRCSFCGFVGDTYEEAIELAKKSAEVTHNHEEGIKGAQAIAGAVWLARHRFTKEEIKEKIEKDFKYNLDKKVDEIHGSHKFDATCQVTVPEAIIAFLESNDFVDCFHKAIWIGGDSDTIADMACAIAGAYYGIPSWTVESIMNILPEKLKIIAIKMCEYGI